MNVFYNKEGIGDTLIVWIADVPRERRGFHRKGDVARLFDKDSDETTGYNIFNISQYGNVAGTGILKANESLTDLINKIIRENGFDQEVSFDDTPDFIVGYVKSKEKHPDADKLSVCQVDIGDRQLQIVCGAPNVEKGQKVVVARVGTVMPSGTIIKEANLRGVDSSGMICAARELDLPNAPQKKGILVLSDQFEVGRDYFEQHVSIDV